MQVIPSGLVPSSLADSAHFTGRVWRTDYLEPVDPDRIAGARFLYEPGAGSFCHVHEQEQAIIAVYGTGIVAWQGLDAPRTLEVGDGWHVAPDVPHWHGVNCRPLPLHISQ